MDRYVLSLQTALIDRGGFFYPTFATAGRRVPVARYYPARLRAFLQMMREAVPDITGMRLPASGA